jgi:hypothetical protein
MEALCGHCGAKIWSYPTPNGKADTVALDAGVGPYVLEGLKAYKQGPTDGFRCHTDYCAPLAEWRRHNHVSADEFLWWL